MTSALHVVPFGDDALLVEVADLAAVRRLDDALRRAREGTDASVWGAVVDQVPAATTVLLRTTPGVDVAALAAAVRRVWRTARTADHTGDAEPADAHGRRGLGQVVELPVRYDGEDLTEVAALTRLTVAEVVQRHAGATYTVAFGGFMPGFAYLVGLDPALRVPRRATPRERVPAGAVAIADEFAAVYPAATPGGWRLLGRCDVPLFDVARTPPALLTPGSRVRFVPESQPEPRPAPDPRSEPGREPEPEAAAPHGPAAAPA
ncbi:allophanate hydrolase [Cellulomonas algicola]|uniref:Allophanate hydrolase n=1 Tax=Cellulomonas algicola TaxID=2071633 RepID=A0A401UVX3_9CELL|nr:allophanate hydrolase subunit 1 [Cellulomonas algicola]GCD18836.1 allophanate hydrolase [Cellulomonas algicola]